MTAKRCDSEGAAGASLSVACPSCLHPLVKDILTAGKSLRLLRKSDRARFSGAAVKSQRGGAMRRSPGTAVTPDKDLKVSRLTPLAARPVGSHPRKASNWLTHCRSGSLHPPLTLLVAPNLQAAGNMGCDSMSAAFLSEVLSYLSAYDREAAGGGGASQDGAPPPLAAAPAAASYFALMASAGSGLGRPEPWLHESSAPFRRGGYSGTTTSDAVPEAPPGSQWLPAWTAASSVDDPRWSSVPAPHGPTVVLPPTTASPCQVSCPKPSSCCLSGDRSADEATSESPVSLLDAAPTLMTPRPSPGAASAVSDPSMMDVDDAPSRGGRPSGYWRCSSPSGTPERLSAVDLRGGRSRAASASVDGRVAEPSPSGPLAATDAASKDLEAWHESVVAGMKGWQERLELGMSASALRMGRR